MLALSRGVDEIVIVDGPATVKILDINFKKKVVRLGFEAGDDVRIDRGENTNQDLKKILKSGKLALSRDIGTETEVDGPFAVIFLAIAKGVARIGFVAERHVQITRDDAVQRAPKEAAARGRNPRRN